MSRQSRLSEEPGDEVYVEGILVNLGDPNGAGAGNDSGTLLPPLLATGPADGSLPYLHDLEQDCRWCCGRCIANARELAVETSLDYSDFYSWRTLSLLGAGVGVAAVLANTSLDEDFQQWHDRDVKSRSTDRFACAAKWLGNGTIVIPVFAGAALLGPLGDPPCPVAQAVGDWGSRCTRSVLVGGPPLLALTYLLGASRPSEGRGSHWKPFDDNNGVSGHAFIGAIPFLNAARMVECPAGKVALYGASVLPAWSRINDRRHYLSQAVLGWWLAWLAADVADRTEAFQHNFTLLPQLTDDGVAIEMACRW